MYFYDFILNELNADNIATCMFIISSIATMLQFLLTKCTLPNLKLMKDFLMQYVWNQRRIGPFLKNNLRKLYKCSCQKRSNPDSVQIRIRPEQKVRIWPDPQYCRKLYQDPLWSLCGYGQDADCTADSPPRLSWQENAGHRRDGSARRSPVQEVAGKCCADNGLNNYIDTKTKCRHLKSKNIDL